MIEALIVSQAVTWVVLVVLVAFCLALLRQVGVLHERMTPFGAMISDRGPDVGELAPVMLGRTADGAEIRVGGPSPGGTSTLVFFVAATCPVCKRLLPVVRQFVGEEGLSLVLVGDGDATSYQRLVKDLRLGGVPLLNSPGIGMRYHVGKLPYAVLIDGDGVIRAKGLVNTREHLESLVTAKQLGLRSMRDFLEQARAGADPVPPKVASR